MYIQFFLCLIIFENTLLVLAEKCFHCNLKKEDNKFHENYRLHQHDRRYIHNKYHSDHHDDGNSRFPDRSRNKDQPNGPRGNCGDLCVTVKINDNDDTNFYHNLEPVMCNFGDTVQLTCNSVKDTSWQVGNFSIGYIRSIQIIPEENDLKSSLEFTCTTRSYEKKSLQVKLEARNRTNNSETVKSNKPELIPLRDQQSWPPKESACNCDYGIIHYPTGRYKVWKKNNDNNSVIEKFNENSNGTWFDCINFTKTPSNDIVRRSKTTYIFLLDTEKKSENEEKLIKNSEGDSTKTIVAAVISTIIIILCVLLFGLWYKYMRQKSTEDTSTVVYAEIDNNRTNPPPPPPRNPVTYAKILGTLMPKNSDECHTQDSSTVRRQDQNVTDLHQSQDLTTVRSHNDPAVKCQTQNTYMTMT